MALPTTRLASTVLGSATRGSMELTPRSTQFTPHAASSGRIVYDIGPCLGRGGFGVAYRAIRRDAQTGTTQPCCVKFIDQRGISTWHREAYFGELLRGVPNVIQVLDTFVDVQPGGRVRYVLVTELAEHDNLTTYLPVHGPFSERRAKSQVLGIARAMERLHRMHAVHRDLTPHNIFVMGDRTLKLADFGIAKHIAYGRGVENDALNPAFVATTVKGGSMRLWKRQQDVYQLGQLLAMLLSGEPTRHTSRQVARIDCPDHLKAIVQRAIGPEASRYPTAQEFVAALIAKPQPLKFQRIASLAGCTVVFTGTLSIPRTRAAALARKAGATVQAAVTPGVDVLVLGKPSAHYRAGSRGRKLMELERLREAGEKIRLIDEATFLKLAKMPKRRTPDA